MTDFLKSQWSELLVALGSFIFCINALLGAEWHTALAWGTCGLGWSLAAVYDFLRDRYATMLKEEEFRYNELLGAVNRIAASEEE